MLFQTAALIVLWAAGTHQDLGPVPPGTLRVYLVRHGQALSNLDPAPDLPPDQLDRLTPLGRAQARSAGLALRQGRIDRVLSSPAGRARETAEEIAAALAMAPAEVEPRLRPLDLGRAPSGTPLRWHNRTAEWAAGRDPAPEGGESMEQMGLRVLDLVTSLRKHRAGKSLVLVAHGEVIGAFLGLLQGTPPAGRYLLGIDNGSISVVEVGAEGAPAIVFTNHVPPEPTPRGR